MKKPQQRQAPSRPQSRTVTTEREESRAVATRDRGGPPPALTKRMSAAAGKGLSTAAEDNLVPLIVILQAQSPQCLKRNPAYIEGAEAGMIWLKNAPDPLVDGEQGFDFQPCFYDPLHWVEWVPRDDGGGFVARHAELPDDAEQIPDPKNKERKIWRRKNGNDLIQTRGYSGIAYVNGVALPYAIPLASTNHQFGRALMTALNGQQLPGGERAPIYSSIAHICTRFRQNNQGEWFAFELKGVEWVKDESQYDAGEALHNAFASGEKQAERPDTVVGGEEAGNGGGRKSRNDRM